MRTDDDDADIGGLIDAFAVLIAVIANSPDRPGESEHWRKVAKACVKVSKLTQALAQSDERFRDTAAMILSLPLEQRSKLDVFIGDLALACARHAADVRPVLRDAETRGKRVTRPLRAAEG